MFVKSILPKKCYNIFTKMLDKNIYVWYNAYVKQKMFVKGEIKMIPVNQKRQREISELLNDNGALAKLTENDLACLLGYVKGMIANAELKASADDQNSKPEKTA